MDIIIGELKQNLRYAMREAGYMEHRYFKSGQISYERPLQGIDYPRFHIYISFNNAGVVLKLHLDQKKPSYMGTSAHGGEYDGEIVEQEVKRIKNILLK
ncbi:MAG: hypothetical protein A3A80_02575 [Candidatus Terrybacteria bacterium RIFCSPLOWO2_01_FULL_44_24]|uniref:Uncharacterized protein n=1 Tax=Candidatus Terrybacteria bacterium RIFCSPHIGHO2_01_FULL_43_35 TaxID=1802361 RepID=A0A1G2PGI2_9BACT|nr:MAG: hypothetical protein A2828_02370 [Candidatus Terrybacteria bacterium RIFCSPHIGHO2_01_FULL_43_35]OHA50289.1 MAG: hypothetical protein A3B75_00625 [Candidatus Terrybacteria bacterium RIFCSPHIGHO2_02_FULL_43_14]OHA50958.1 MAG: hypothetical protein A3A80_02575 [Candidatus Terrybacteria bacterium RIFCSPLOWO2_01_FULL_44_24]